jgi:hypothetical protein
MELKRIAVVYTLALSFYAHHNCNCGRVWVTAKTNFKMYLFIYLFHSAAQKAIDVLVQKTIMPTYISWLQDIANSAPKNGNALQLELDAPRAMLWTKNAVSGVVYHSEFSLHKEPYFSNVSSWMMAMVYRTEWYNLTSESP